VISVGQVTVTRGRGVVVAVVTGEVTTGAGVVGTVPCSGTVVAERGATVVAGESLSADVGAVVVVAAEDAPELEPEEDEPDEATEDTGARLLPERSGGRSGGVSSGGLALAMYRLKIEAGNDPPFTFLTPCTS
jgi:hypothetical protein